MKFVVSSTELLSHLQSINKVISPKNTLPILDNFLFHLKEGELEITASDLETTLITTISLDNTSDAGMIAIPARLLTDTLKEFPEQPLTFDINVDNHKVVIQSENGEFNIMGQAGGDFPVVPSIKDENKSSLTIDASVLNKGISKTLFAISEDELRPVMNGIYFELKTDGVTFVSTDAQKLVKYKRKDLKVDEDASFVLPKKPATLLKMILPKEQNNVVLEFDNKNASFTLSGYKVVCRLTEGQFPNYEAVIPKENPNKMIVDRVDFNTIIRRVAVFSNQASNLVKISLKNNQATVSAQDLDFSISAKEDILCQYDGQEMEMGFKSLFLNEILSNLESGDVVLEMSDPSRAGIFKPIETDDENEEVLMLLMPMMVNA